MKLSETDRAMINDSIRLDSAADRDEFEHLRWGVCDWMLGGGDRIDSLDRSSIDQARLDATKDIENATKNPIKHTPGHDSRNSQTVGDDDTSGDEFDPIQKARMEAITEIEKASRR